MEQLTFTEFTEQALRTESQITEAKINHGSFIALLDLFIAVGTLLDYTKKGIFYNNYAKYDEFYKELMFKLQSGMLDLQRAESEGELVTSSAYNFRVLHGLLGAMTEASELAEHLKAIAEGGAVDVAGISEEFSDIDWYKAIIFDEFNLSETVARTNVINKLKVRFPDKYSHDSALNRNLGSERTELEKNIVS